MRRSAAALVVVGVAVLAACGDDGTRATTESSPGTTVEPSTTAPTEQTTASTLEATTSSVRIPESTTTAFPAGLPGRTPPSDATDDTRSLIPPGFSARSSTELAGQILTGLQQKWVGCATVTIDSMVGALSEEAAVVYDIRNQEACGDDAVAGEDLVVVMKPTSVVNQEPVGWQVVRASRQYVCLRGVTEGVCV